MIALLTATGATAQVNKIKWSAFPGIPDQEGFAGMYAGVSSGAIIAMGGANFPDKYPWENGVKKWYDHIYVKPAGGNWQRAKESLPVPAGYGVSVSYQNKVIIAGGCTDSHHLKTVFSYEWVNGELKKETLPDLPFPLAYMTGELVEDALVLLGGAETPTGPALKTALVLDLKNPNSGWQEIESWPGPERKLPVSGVWNNRVYLMSGETANTNPLGEVYRDILLDNYALTLTREGRKWKATWQKMAPIPRGVAAAGNLPLLDNDKFLIWGGVDRVTAQYRTPATHPGINRTVLFYYPQNDTWEYLGEQLSYQSRVTLAVIPYENSWLYISGEIKPGVRTPSNIQIHKSTQTFAK